MLRITSHAPQIMLGVDRLDMVKGIPQKLLAFEKFLEEHAEWRDKVRNFCAASTLQCSSHAAPLPCVASACGHGAVIAVMMF